MDLFKTKFVNEANDLVEDLEEAVLSLESNKEDHSLIEKIFRIMHTFKGNSNMFGFEHIGEFTHHLETIYDFVRNGQMSVSTQLFDLTFLSVDHIKNLLRDEELLNGENASNHASLLQKIESIIDGYKKKGIVNNSSSNNSRENSEIKTFHISFTPFADVFSNGTNPLYLIDDLLQLGEGKAFPNVDNLPGMEELNPGLCYVVWNIFLATKENEVAIKDVFLFAEDKCYLKITCLSPDKNLFKEKTFSDLLNELNLLNDSNRNKKIIEQLLYKPSFVEIKNSSSFKKELISKEGSNIKVPSEKLDELMSLVSELVTTQARLSLFSEGIHNSDINVIAENIEKISRRLRDNTFSICLVPIGSIHTRFKRLVRDLSSELAKEVEFNVEGSETELDKTIIESITDPLMHIIRNSMDHGIEQQEERLKVGKPAKGNILLKAYYSGANIHIDIIDDGKGLDADKIWKKGIEKGLIQSTEKPNNREIFDLIFMPGFSTADKVTEISGRGVGMDVVKRNISNVRGDISIESEMGKGTTISIILPLTLSIIDGLLVKIGKTNFIIPLSSVEKCYEVNHEVFLNNYKGLIVLDGVQLPYMYLRDEFEIYGNSPSIEQIVVVKYEDKRIGISVDSIIGEYQAVLKPLGKLYKSVQIISGATILGDGSVALVIDSGQIIKQILIQHKNKEVIYEH